MKRDVTVEVNSNFHRVGGEDPFVGRDGSFKEYRKKWNEWPRNFHTGGFPLFLDIEVTSVCNLKCPFCATTFKADEIKKGFISSGVVKKMIDEGSLNNLYGVKFNIRGEPLLHPEIHDFVKYAKEKGLVDVYFNTNAMLLTEGVIRRLIDAGLDRLSISVEGHTKEIYEKYRIGGDFETILTNIENVRSLKKKLKVRHPKIRVQSVMLPGLENVFDDYKRFWSKRADDVAYLDYKEMKEKKKSVRYFWSCPQIWQRMAIQWDGTILPCNHDDDGLIALGNIADISIREAWHSQRLKDIREAHKKGRSHQIRACDGCYLRTSEIHKLMQGEKR